MYCHVGRDYRCHYCKHAPILLVLFDECMYHTHIPCLPCYILHIPVHVLSLHVFFSSVGLLLAGILLHVHVRITINRCACFASSPPANKNVRGPLCATPYSSSALCMWLILLLPRMAPINFQARHSSL
ncbi:hypothetical protein M441DRAFT_289587 [Trichoderma asperellum CBS 433.97]|uniref:Uncharacterized protein n=1 Tax=Trichoderma asperellum (strain ATCC 204424 / CBS 433.97 / NBRC 101777) TaxID=1042311 RepID=A0A2T3YTY2_TRIA4|nr:hypothetical protein M441DRAFT_289587 [Trichoderma asperellum CBS 433.97]PTB35966.1 hypothetical protein M441DRAFT_289587 [Trichoderma asperellum CBS 433.97]